MSSKSPVKKSETRSRLMDRVSSKPGISLPELLRYFPLKEGTLRYHLNMLEKNKKIHSKMHRGRRCYYTGAKQFHRTGQTQDEAIGHLSDVQKSILLAVEEMSDLTQKELVRALGKNRFVVSYNLGQLKDLGLVRVRRDGRSVHYRRSYPDDIKKDILRALAADLLRGRMDEETYRKLRDRVMEDW